MSGAKCHFKRYCDRWGHFLLSGERNVAPTLHQQLREQLGHQQRQLEKPVEETSPSTDRIRRATIAAEVDLSQNLVDPARCQAIRP